MSKSLKEQYASTPLFGSNATAVEALYEQFLEKPESVPDEWRGYFATLANGGGDVAHGPIVAKLKDQGRQSQVRSAAVAPRSGAVAAASFNSSRLRIVYDPPHLSADKKEGA